MKNINLVAILFLLQYNLPAQDYCSFSTDGSGKSIGMKIKMFYPCSWTNKDINDTRTIKNFTSTYKNDCITTSNLILIPTPQLLNKEQFEFSMSTPQLTKMMKGKGEVQEIHRLNFDNFDGAEIYVKTMNSGFYYYSVYYYMYSNKGLMVLNYFIGSESDNKAVSEFNKNIRMFRKLAQKTTLLNPLPNQGLTTSNTTKPTYQEWAKTNPTETDKSSSNDKIEGSLYRNTKYSFRIRFIDNWEMRKGDSKLAVIKSVQPDSGKSFLVLVSDYPNFKLEDEEITDIQLQEDKKNAIQIFRTMNMEPLNYQVVKGYLNNFPASIATFSTIAKSQTKIVAYKYKHGN